MRESFFVVDTGVLKRMVSQTVQAGEADLLEVSTGDGVLSVVSAHQFALVRVRAYTRLDGLPAEPKRVTVGARLFAAIVKGFAGPTVTVTFDDANDRLLVTSGKSQYEVRYVSGELPSQPPTGDGVEFTVDAAELAEMLDVVAWTASNDDTRPLLTGLKFAAGNDGLSFVATDSYRASKVTGGRPGDRTEAEAVVVPATLTAVRSLVPEGDVTVKLLDTAVVVTGPGCEIWSTLLQGDYPAVESLIAASEERNSGWVVMEKNVAVDAVNQALAMRPGDTDYVELSTIVGVGIQWSLTVPADGHMRTVTDIKMGQGRLDVLLNPKYLAQALKSCPDDLIRIGFCGGLAQPLVMTCETVPSWRHLLMPCRR